ncbi:MAG TPA: PqqD family protein [Gemmatimonadales bacterium]
MSEVRYELRSGDVTGKVIDGEAIVMNLATGAYYSLDGAGAVLWELLEQGYSRNEAVEALYERFAAEREVIARDADGLIAELVAEDLVTESTARVAPLRMAFEELRAEYTAPALNKFTDMADLLALDPPMPGLDETSWGEAAIAD